ncbi:hypothetical protein [Pradoshia sp. D12]|nr:hypothetical protein [Pradoshia sp. D12]
MPEQAITKVFNTIMESRVMHLLVFEEKKANTVKQLFEGEISEAFPLWF